MIENKQTSEVKPEVKQEQAPEEQTYNVTLTRAERDLIVNSLNEDRDVEAFIRTQRGALKYKFLAEFIEGTKD